MKRKFFIPRHAGEPPRTAIFMSGSGSNAEVLLRLAADGRTTEYNIVALVTDNPEHSRTEELSRIFKVPMVALSIRGYYRSRGEKRVSLASENCRRIRAEWTAELLTMLEPFELDFGIFAGFVPLCDVTEAFPCLNVHPGDLTVTDDAGNRLLVGLNTAPVERAILAGFSTLRSSVMVTEPIAPDGCNVDAGPLLGISAPLNIDFRDYPLAELREIAARRPAKRPVGGYNDDLEQVASFNQERLKYAGDHVVLPRSAAYFARNLYEIGDRGELLFNRRGRLTPIKTIEFSPDGSEQLLEP